METQEEVTKHFPLKNILPIQGEPMYAYVV